MIIARFVLLAALAAATTAAAHDLWLESDGADYLLYQGHRDSDHAGADQVPYVADFVRAAQCVATAGGTHAAAITAGYPTRLAGPCAALAVEASSGVWSQTIHGTHHGAPAGLTGVVKSWRSEEGIKLLTVWIPAVAWPLGDGLEVTPLRNPFTVRPGDKMRLVVTYHGRPKAGVSVAYDEATRGVTGADGRINVRIRHAGPQLINASFEEPLSDGPVQSVVHEATLRFALPGVRR